MSATSIIVASFGVAIAGITVVWYFLQQRHNEKTAGIDDARSEALALADTRGKRIDDLQADIERLQKARRDDRENHDKEIQGLRRQLAALEERVAGATRDFAVAQALTARATIDLVVRVKEHLEKTPPQTKEALLLLSAYTHGHATPNPE